MKPTIRLFGILVATFALGQTPARAFLPGETNVLAHLRSEVTNAQSAVSAVMVTLTNTTSVVLDSSVTISNAGRAIIQVATTNFGPSSYIARVVKGQADKRKALAAEARAKANDPNMSRALRDTYVALREGLKPESPQLNAALASIGAIHNELVRQGATLLEEAKAVAFTHDSLAFMSPVQMATTVQTAVNQFTSDLVKAQKDAELVTEDMRKLEEQLIAEFQ